LNIQNFHDTDAVWNSENKDSIIISDELEEALKLTKIGKSPGEDISNQNYINTHQKILNRGY
jgi:hypothetical protein